MKTPNILFFDIETSPNLAHVWGKWQQDVIAFESEWELLCFAFKWQGDKVYAYGRQTLTEAELVQLMWNLFDTADIIIAHNGNRFDIPKMNAKFLEFGLTPPSPYKTVDTLQISKRYFKFTSNKLDDLGAKLGLGRKIQTGGFALWKGCMENDPKAWKKMLRYNIQDVLLLEKVYLKLRPWMENHPSIGVMIDKPKACRACGNEKLTRRGYRIAVKRKYARLRCNRCGHWQPGELIK